MSYNDKISVLIPDGESPHAISVLRCLGLHKNYNIIVLANTPKASIRYSRYISKFHSYKKAEGFLETIIKIVKESGVDIILPVDQPAIYLISENYNTLSNLTTIAPVPDIKSFNTVSDKWLFADWLTKQNFPTPKTILYKTDLNSSENQFSSILFPALIKPRQGTGGHGIKFFDDLSSLQSFCREDIWDEKFIVQSFIKGYDYDFSAICKNGKILAYTIQKEFMSGAYQFAPSGGIEFIVAPDTHTLASRLVKELNWSGILHIDLRYDVQGKQINIIEINPRYWGSLTASVFAGVNFPNIACLIGLKRKLPEIKIRQVRVGMPQNTIKLFRNRLFRKNRKHFKVDHLSIIFLLKDPIPVIYRIFGKILKINGVT